jgi:hypothetical protein
MRFPLALTDDQSLDLESKLVDHLDAMHGERYWDSNRVPSPTSALVHNQLYAFGSQAPNS